MNMGVFTCGVAGALRPESWLVWDAGVCRYQLVDFTVLPCAEIRIFRALCMTCVVGMWLFAKVVAYSVSILRLVQLFCGSALRVFLHTLFAFTALNLVSI